MLSNSAIISSCGINTGIGLKFRLLISRKVVSLARFIISFCKAATLYNRNKFDIPSLGLMAMKS